MIEHEYLTTDDLALLLRTSPESIRYWRHVRRGPTSFKAGRRVLYARDDVRAWLEERRQAALASRSG